MHVCTRCVCIGTLSSVPVLLLLHNQLHSSSNTECRGWHTRLTGTSVLLQPRSLSSVKKQLQNDCGVRLRHVCLHAYTAGSEEASGEDTCYGEDPETAPPPHLVLSKEEWQQHEEAAVV